MKINKFVITAIILFLLFSCNRKNLDNFFTSKYKEKNNVKALDVTITRGNVEIAGWPNNYIEIAFTKKIINGLKTDLKLINVDFRSDETKLTVEGSIPERINGEISLIINVPYDLLKINLKSNEAKVHVDKYPGDLEINCAKGLINTEFSGCILRISSEEAIINANINAFNSSDIVLKNKDGDINVKINTARENSFMDIKSLNGNIYLNISGNLPHRFSVTNKSSIDVKYPYRKIADMHGEYNYLSGIFINDGLKIDISDINGKVTLNQIVN